MVLVVEVGEEYRAEAPVRQRNIHGDVEVRAFGPVFFESR
jgi:hypothetical protein